MTDLRMVIAEAPPPQNSQIVAHSPPILLHPNPDVRRGPHRYSWAVATTLISRAFARIISKRGQPWCFTQGEDDVLGGGGGQWQHPESTHASAHLDLVFSFFFGFLVVGAIMYVRTT